MFHSCLISIQRQFGDHICDSAGNQAARGQVLNHMTNPMAATTRPITINDQRAGTPCNKFTPSETIIGIIDPAPAIAKVNNDTPSKRCHCGLK